jgi:hypothetical protein
MDDAPAWRHGLLARNRERYTTIPCRTITTGTRIASGYEALLDGPRTRLKNKPKGCDR